MTWLKQLLRWLFSLSYEADYYDALDGTRNEHDE
jgi:hypothetical protein